MNRPPAKHLVEKNVVLLVASNDTANGVTTNTDGNYVRVITNDAIKIPLNALYCYMTVPEVTLWYNTPNISAALGNNKIYYSYLAGSYTMTLTDGLYDLDLLNQEIATDLTNEAGIPSDLFELVANSATQKCSIHFNYADTQIDFTQADTCREILGFDSVSVPSGTTTTGESYYEATNIAAFNSINYFLIKSDIISQGLRVNTFRGNIIDRVMINVSPGSQIVQRKENPERIECSDLIGTSIRDFYVKVLDQNGDDVTLLGEDFSVLLVFHYGVLRSE